MQVICVSNLFEMLMGRFRNIFFMLCIASEIFAQKQFINQHSPLLWTRYHATLQFSKKTFWVSEFDNRIFASNFNQNQFITHHHFHYRFNNNIESSAGITYSFINFREPDTQTGFITPEIRPFQELYVRQNLTKNWRIQHRFRNEQRFFRNTNGKELLDGYTYNGRARYQVAIGYKFAPKWELRANDELFINHGKNIIFNTFDHNRTYGGLAFQPKPSLTAELGYLKSIQQRSNGYEFVERNHIRFSIFHVITFK